MPCCILKTLVLVQFVYFNYLFLWRDGLFHWYELIYSLSRYHTLTSFITWKHRKTFLLIGNFFYAGEYARAASAVGTIMVCIFVFLNMNCFYPMFYILFSSVYTWFFPTHCPHGLLPSLRRLLQLALAFAFSSSMWVWKIIMSFLY